MEVSSQTVGAIELHDEAIVEEAMGSPIGSDHSGDSNAENSGNTAKMAVNEKLSTEKSGTEKTFTDNHESNVLGDSRRINQKKSSSNSNNQKYVPLKPATAPMAEEQTLAEEAEDANHGEKIASKDEAAMDGEDKAQEESPEENTAVSDDIEVAKEDTTMDQAAAEKLVEEEETHDKENELSDDIVEKLCTEQIGEQEETSEKSETAECEEPEDSESTTEASESDIEQEGASNEEAAPVVGTASISEGAPALVKHLQAYEPAPIDSTDCISVDTPKIEGSVGTGESVEAHGSQKNEIYLQDVLKDNEEVTEKMSTTAVLLENVPSDESFPSEPLVATTKMDTSANAKTKMKYGARAAKEAINEKQTTTASSVKAVVSALEKTKEGGDLEKAGKTTKVLRKPTERSSFGKMYKDGLIPGLSLETKGTFPGGAKAKGAGPSSAKPWPFDQADLVANTIASPAISMKSPRATQNTRNLLKQYNPDVSSNLVKNSSLHTNHQHFQPQTLSFSVVLLKRA
jgi:hypothetical protein